MKLHRLLYFTSLISFLMDPAITGQHYLASLSDDLKELKKMYGEDGVHPNLAGYMFMEPLAEEGITKALKKK